MSMSNNPGRSVVGAAAFRDDTNIPPKTVVQFAKVDMCAVELIDESGRRVTTVAFKIGDNWFHDSTNGENWMKSLRPIAKNTWLESQLSTRMAFSGDLTVPNKDSVDVMGGK